MSNTEMNRQIVQEGLDRKQTSRRQRMSDAAHDAAERKLRVTINQHAQERQTEKEAAEADERRQEERRIQSEANRAQAEADRAQEDKDVEKTLRLTARLFGSLLYAVLVTFGYHQETISAGVALTAIGLAAIYCVVVFVNHTVRINREGGQHERVHGSV
ncbi:MAG: hypothetical protein J6A26_01830 [Oscillospiraceae bacterium]|nr:hypothetical protein [Oscillospiraceae bacterium]